MGKGYLKTTQENRNNLRYHGIGAIVPRNLLWFGCYSLVAYRVTDDNDSPKVPIPVKSRVAFYYPSYSKHGLEELILHNWG